VLPIIIGQFQSLFVRRIDQLLAHTILKNNQPIVFSTEIRKLLNQGLPICFFRIENEQVGLAIILIVLMQSIIILD